jgi:aminopeptidase N
VEITCAEKTETYRIVVDSESQSFHFNLPSKPHMVVVDKGGWTLKTLEFQKPTDELLYQLKYGDMLARIAAARDLGASDGDDRVVGALGEVLASDAFWGLRREAALALGQSKAKGAQALLVEALKTKEARVRLAAAEALGKLMTSEDLDKTLLGVLRNDYAYDVRAAAVSSLVAMKSKQATKACVEALGMESGQEVIRNAGVNGLVELKATGEIDKVKTLATPGHPRESRHTAITGYAKLAKKLESDSKREAAADFLCDMLDDWHLRTRSTVISALGELGSKSAVKPLHEVAANDPIESIREQAAKMASAIETRQEVVAETEDLQNELKALSSKLDGLRNDLRSLQASAPVPSKSSDSATSGTAAGRD